MSPKGSIAFAALLLLSNASVNAVRGGNRIVGGEDASLEDYPWQISLRNIVIGLSHFCGGSIVSPYWVLTAAHCVDGLGPVFMQVIAGQENIHVPDENEQVHFVNRIISHPEYDYTSFEHDIALVRLTEPLEYGELVGEVPLTEVDVPVGMECDATGWGTTRDDGILLSSTLQKVSVPVVSDDECGRAYPTDLVPPSMICAGSEGRDSCSADSGGPLVCPLGEDGSLVLSGVTSYGTGCGDEGFPGVYTDVLFYSDWIWQTIEEEGDV